MAATGFKGIDVRQTGNQLVFRVSIKDALGAKVISGTTTLAIYELESDGTLKSYDFNDNTFKTTALITGTVSMTHRTGNNGTANTGVWTYSLATLTGFAIGGMYLIQVNNALGAPTDQEREFMYGSAEGDLVVTANGTGLGEVNADVQFWKGATAPANTGDAYAFLTTNLGALGANLSHVSANLTQILGTTLTETAGFLAAGFKKFFNIASPTLTTGGVDQSGDGFAVVNSGIVLAASQPNYAPAKAGDRMNLVDAPNSTAVAALQAGLATLANQATIIGGLGANIPITSDSVASASGSTVFTGSGALSSADGAYVNMVVVFTSGANARLARRITAYAGSTKQITLDSPLPATPGVADSFDILGYAG